MPDWAKLPLVAILPFSLTVKLGVPLDWIESKVLGEPTLVSLITIAVAVPWLVMVKLEGWAVLARVKVMLRLLVVVISLPPL